MGRIGVVVIGRNEGERLTRCLQSVRPNDFPVVYVDSGSSDGSAENARRLGAHVVELDLTTPFTAARARNEGLRKLIAEAPETAFVQFVDGDCELSPTWIEQAREILVAEPRAAVVCGRLRERRPEASIYNRLCDLEWGAPAAAVTQVDACGGIALMRVASVQQVGGFRDGLIAGEEPELCLRMRMENWTILRCDADMGLHDADMHRFGQWWKRSVRAGFAFAEVSRLHRHSRITMWKKETRSNWFWGLLLPLMALVPAPFTWGLSALLLLGYPLLFWKIRRQRSRAGLSFAGAYAFYCVLGKFPMAWGQIRFHWRRCFGGRTHLIEYKESSSRTATPERAP